MNDQKYNRAIACSGLGLIMTGIGIHHFFGWAADAIYIGALLVLSGSQQLQDVQSEKVIKDLVMSKLGNKPSEK